MDGAPTVQTKSLQLFLARERFEPNGANKNAVLRKCPHHSASQHSPRQKSDTGFEAQILAGFESHILKAERRLHSLDVVSQPSRTFESPRARRDAPNKRRSLLKRWAQSMTATRAVLRAKRATETSKRAFSLRHGSSSPACAD
jgi:hypothetical protein